MKLGLSSFTFPWAVGRPGMMPAVPMDEQALLHETGGAGLGLLQVGDNLPLHTIGLERLERLARRAAGACIELQVGARRLAPERIQKYVEIARLINAKVICLRIDDADYHPPPSTVIDLLLDSLKLLDGLTLAVKNTERMTAAKLRAIIETVGSERVGVCLDTANSIGAGEGLESVVTTLAPVTVNLHIKDFGIQRSADRMGFIVTGRPAGEGMVDLVWVLKQLEKHRCRASAILEQWTPSTGNLDETIALESEWAARSVRYLKPFFTMPGALLA
jgi:sugar phosphate isomerase/epimerase